LTLAARNSSYPRFKADNRTLVFVRDESGRATRIDSTWPEDFNTCSLSRM